MVRQLNIDVDFTVEGHLQQLAQDNNAIDLSGNYSSFPFPQSMEEQILAYMKSVTGYAPAEGAHPLRAALSEYISKKYFRRYCPVNEITITAGASQAVFTAIASSVKEGDEVIIFEPSYPSLAMAIGICGARPVFLRVKEGDSLIDWAEVQKAITTRTKLIIIFTPHNILGRVFSADDMENLQKLISGTKIRVISDESLGEIVYSDALAASATFYPKLVDSCFIVGSLSQSLGLPGWKVGYCLAPKPLMERFRVVQCAVVSSVNHPVQLALADYVASSSSLFSNLHLLESNRDIFLQGLGQSRFRVLPSMGGFFQVLDYSAISPVKDVEFCEMLIKEHGVAAAPLSGFFHDKFNPHQLRINLAAKTDSLVEAAVRLSSL